MNEELLLENLKYDLQLLNDNQDSFLKTLLATAYEDLTRMGINLIPSMASDGMLVVEYARYLYRKRRSNDPRMPNFLRYQINCRLIDQTGDSYD